MRHLLVIAVVASLAAASAGGGAAAVGRASGDPLQSQEWWLSDVGAEAAAPPGPGVPLTIVDGAADLSHPELAGRPDTVALNDATLSGPSDYQGTAVASLAAAPANGVGIVGLYPQARLQLWNASVGGALVGYETAIGIETAAAHCPGVIDLSFGSIDPDPFVEQAVLTAVHDGCLVVAAGGNGRQDGNHPFFPGDLPHVLTVAATTRQDTVASFSTESPDNDLAAPGDGLLAAVTPGIDPSLYGSVSGTGYAAPLVAAAAAWLWTVRPQLDAGQVAEVLRSTARDVGPKGFDMDTGFGILDVGHALAAPAPPRDPWEPNDDVDQVKPGALFADGQPALTSPLRPSNRITATLDANEDPSDLYRIWVPPRRTVTFDVEADGNAAARIWGPQTVSVREGIAARRRDLVGPSLAAGARGVNAYVEVLLTGRRPRTTYTLVVRASRR